MNESRYELFAIKLQIPQLSETPIKCKSTKFDSVLTVLCRIHRKCVRKLTLAKYIFAGPFLSILDATLFMPNQILRWFIKKYIDFHKKFAKIEDFKVDYSKKTTKFPKP